MPNLRRSLSFCNPNSQAIAIYATTPLSVVSCQLSVVSCQLSVPAPPYRHSSFQRTRKHNVSNPVTFRRGWARRTGYGTRTGTGACPYGWLMGPGRLTAFRPIHQRSASGFGVVGRPSHLLLLTSPLLLADGLLGGLLTSYFFPLTCGWVVGRPSHLSLLTSYLRMGCWAGTDH